MRLKVAMKLLSIFGIEAEVAKLLHNFSLKCMENKQNLAKLTNVAKNFLLKAQKLLRIYDLRTRQWLAKLLRFSKI